MPKRLYQPGSNTPFPLSRTKIDLSLECPRCFYVDVRLGQRRPSGPPYLLNLAVDTLMKKEFDVYRTKQEAHPLMNEFRVGLVPVQRPDLDTWRYNFKGVRFLHPETNFDLFGAIDDLWVDLVTEEYFVVDYKSTSKKDTVSVSNVFPGYWRQLEFYQYLIAKQGLKVSNIGILVYGNASKMEPEFGGTLNFDVRIVTKTSNNSWVEKAVQSAWNILNLQETPNYNPECQFCMYSKFNSEINNEFEKQTQYTLPI
jgi:hypothetical protein